MKKEEKSQQTADELKNEITEEVKHEGVLDKGYGLMPKIIMLDPNLSIEAKSLYAFFCSFCGSGSTAYPGREYIYTFLNIGKHVYYKALNELKDKGLISVEQVKTNGMFSKNIYTLVNNPKEYLSKTIPCVEENNTLAFGGLLKYGYGLIPKIVMIDQDLTPKTKALYAYLSVFTGAGQVSFPKKQYTLHHLDISSGTYQKCLNELVCANYVQVSPKRDKGKFIGNDYIIVENPYKPATVANSSPEYKNWDTVNQDTAEWDTVNQDTNNNKVNINNHKKNRIKKDSAFNITDDEYLNNSDNANKKNSVVKANKGKNPDDQAILSANAAYNIFEDDRFNLYPLEMSQEAIDQSEHYKTEFDTFTKTKLAKETYFKHADIAHFYLLMSEVYKTTKIPEDTINEYLDILASFSDVKTKNTIKHFSESDHRSILSKLSNAYIEKYTGYKDEDTQIYDLRGYCARMIMNIANAKNLKGEI